MAQRPDLEKIEYHVMDAEGTPIDWFSENEQSAALARALKETQDTGKQHSVSEARYYSTMYSQIWPEEN